MRTLKKISILAVLLFLSACGINNNPPVVDERPYESVSLEEATSYIENIVQKENLRHHLKEAVFLDFEELDNITDDFLVGDIILENTNFNNFKVSFYHIFSNYEVVLELFLDKEPEGFIIYNASVSETTYLYTDPMFSEMHANNITSYINDNTSSNIDVCQRFDTTNTHCLTYIQSIRSLKSTLNINKTISYDDYFILNLQLTNDWIDITDHYIATEVQIGLNDEGSFVYDMSFLQDHDVELTTSRYRTYIFQMLKDLDEGNITSSEACQKYFYGDYDCLSGLTQFKLDNKNVISNKSFGPENIYIEDSYYRLSVDYSPTYSLVRDIIDYDLYETENGHIFFNEVFLFNASQLLEHDEDSVLNQFLYNIYSDLNKDDFCEIYKDTLYNCDDLKEAVTFQNYTISIEDVHENDSLLSTSIRFTDDDLGDSTLLHAEFEIEKSAYSIVNLKQSENQSINFYLGFNHSVAIFKQMYLDLGNSEISLDQIKSNYRTVLSDIFILVREQYLALNMEQFMSNWVFTTDEYDGLEVIKLVSTPYEPLVGETVELYFTVEKEVDAFRIEIFNLQEAILLVRYDQESFYIDNMLSDMRNPNLSNEEVCKSLYEEDACVVVRELLQNEDYDAIIDTQITPDYKFLAGSMIIYDLTTSSTVSFIHFQVMDIATFTTDTLLMYNFEIGNYYAYPTEATTTVSAFLQDYWNDEILTEDFCEDYTDYDICTLQRNQIIGQPRTFSREIIYDEELDILYFKITFTIDGTTRNQYFSLIPYVKDGAIYFNIEFLTLLYT